MINFNSSNTFGTSSWDLRNLMSTWKECKDICGGLATIHKPFDWSGKIINFTRGLALNIGLLEL